MSLSAPTFLATASCSHISSSHPVLWHWGRTPVPQNWQCQLQSVETVYFCPRLARLRPRQRHEHCWT